MSKVARVRGGNRGRYKRPVRRLAISPHARRYRRHELGNIIAYGKRRQRCIWSLTYAVGPTKLGGSANEW